MILCASNIYDVRGNNVLLFGYHKEFIFEERGFFEISQNKNPSKITCYMVATVIVSLQLYNMDDQGSAVYGSSFDINSSI